MKKYISLVALIIIFENLIGSQSPKDSERKVRFSDNLVVRVYNSGMPITRDDVLLKVSSQNFVLFHTTYFTKDQLAQRASLSKRFLYAMGCTPHLKSPYSEKSK